MLSDFILIVLIVLIVVPFWMVIRLKAQMDRIVKIVIEVTSRNDDQFEIIQQYLDLQKNQMQLEKENALLLEKTYNKVNEIEENRKVANEEAIKLIKDAEFVRELNESVEVDFIDQPIEKN